jgi:hypothetical protein
MRAKKAMSTVFIVRRGEASRMDEAGETTMVLHEMPQEFSLANASGDSLRSILQMVSVVDARRIQRPGVVCNEPEKSFQHATHHSLLALSKSTERRCAMESSLEPMPSRHR